MQENNFSKLDLFDKGHVGWIGNKDQIYDVENDDLNNFVYATDLFRDVRKYRREHGYKPTRPPKQK